MWCRQYFIDRNDGYDKDNPKQQVMIAALERFCKNNPQFILNAITPTTYPISQRHMYDTGIKIQTPKI